MGNFMKCMSRSEETPATTSETKEQTEAKTAQAKPEVVYDDALLDAVQMRMCMESLDAEDPTDPEEIRLRALVLERLEKSRLKKKSS